MDDIIEFILELVLELGAEAAGSKRVPKWIRYPLLAVFFLLYCALTIGLIACGFIIFDDSPIFAIILLGFGLFILIGGIWKIRKEYNKKQEESIEP